MAEDRSFRLAVPDAVLAAWGLAGAALSALGNGLINHTLLASPAGGEPLVLQRLHRIFTAEVNEDIDAVTRHLAAQGHTTPRLVPTLAGRLWLDHDDGIWRALTYVPGVSLDALDDVNQACEAGALLGRFHRALGGLQHRFRHARTGVHDTARHLANLRTALDQNRAHPRYAEIAPLGERIFAMARDLPPLPAVPERVVHGDPKLNNILFTPDRARALCMIDLDTLTRMSLPLELGDAFRSWCNPAGEDYAKAWFSLDLFGAALAGYAREARGFITPSEWQAIVPATQTICVELAARFCADALNETYFGWNPQRFASRSEHNQVRAEGQLAAAESLRAQGGPAEATVSAAFASH
jgi:Ser/Thr protein kinase RdoA (MazF antagonist)